MPEPEPDATRRNPFTCSCSTDGDEVVIWLGGELDIAARAAFVEAVDAVLPDGKAIVADLSGLNFIDSAGISSILQCRNTAAAAGLPFHIRGAGGLVQMVFAVTGLDGFLATSS